MAIHKLITNRQVCELIQQKIPMLRIGEILGCSYNTIFFHKRDAQKDEGLMKEFPLARIKKHDKKPKQKTFKEKVGEVFNKFKI